VKRRLAAAKIRAASALLALMRILVAGASGVLGRATLPHLERHEVVGLTRTNAKRELVRKLGAEAVVCDVYDYQALLTVVARAQPQTVVNFLTALRTGSEANNRIRREGASNLFAAAERAGAARLVVESVAFPLEGDAACALDELERSTRAFAGEALILRFGRLWGPRTFHQGAAAPPSIHIDRAGAEAARLITGAPPGTYTVAD
jgi:NAD dependent epimerase/dehydratase family